MERDRQARVGGRVPERVPVVVTEEGFAVRLGVASEQDALDPELGDPLDLLDRLLHVPERDRRVGDEALGRRGDPLDLKVVPGAHALEHQLGLVELEEALRGEAGDVGIEDLRVDAGLVHHLEPLVHVKRGGVSSFVGGRRVGELALPTSEHARGSSRDLLVADKPGVDALVVLLDVQNLVAPTSWTRDWSKGQPAR